MRKVESSITLVKQDYTRGSEVGFGHVTGEKTLPIT